MVPLSSTGRPLPVGSEKHAYVRSMFDAIAPRYDRVNRIISLGFDGHWRRRTVDELRLAPGALVVDVATGTGDLAREAEGHGARVIGVDLALQMLVNSPRRAVAESDALSIPLRSGSVDGVSIGFALRNFADLAGVLDEVARVLRAGGRLALLETDRPSASLLRVGHRLWLEVAVPAIGALLSDAEAYRYLPRSLAYLPSHEELASLLAAAGFVDVTRIGLLGGAAQIIGATREPTTGRS